MLASQRQSQILEMLRRTGGVQVRHLVHHFGVSVMTIRRDLEILAGRGLACKVHGGAIVAVDDTGESRFATKAVRQRAEKAAIAAHAVTLVQPGTAVALSAGTTTAALANLLVWVPGVTVVTNSLPVADVLHRASHVKHTVVLTGGVRTPSDALVGPVAEAAIASFNVDVLFLGVHGMSPRAGFTTPNLLEAGANRLLVAAARRVVVLADHTKWDVVAVAAIAGLAEADALITDDGLSDAAFASLYDRVGELVVVTAGDRPARH